MQRLARYPLEKENRAMMVTKAQSCVKKESSESLMLHIMSRGMKTSRASTAAGNSWLSFDGCSNRDGKITSILLIYQKLKNILSPSKPAARLTHCTRDGVLRPTRSMVLKTMKQQTQVNTLSVRDRAGLHFTNSITS